MLPSRVSESIDHTSVWSNPDSSNCPLPSQHGSSWSGSSLAPSTKITTGLVFFPCFLHVSTEHGKTGKGADPWRDLSSTRSLSHIGEDCRTSESIVSTTGGNEKRIDISRRKSNNAEDVRGYIPLGPKVTIRADRFWSNTLETKAIAF